MAFNGDYMIKFKKAQRKLAQNDIYLRGNDGTVCMEIMFQTNDLIKYLNNHEGGGLKRIQDLSSLICQEGLGIVDYHGDSINKWVRSHEDLFHDVDPEHIEKGRLHDITVYMNYAGRQDGERDELNEYIKTAYSQEELEKANQYNDGMSWYWIGEY